MPMCYIYRNAIELRLKQMIIEYSHINYSDALKILKRKKHSILGLWNSISSEIERFADEGSPHKTFEDVKKYINMFHNVDFHSDLFRYPCNKNLDVYFSTAQKYDIENIASCFEELISFLSNVSHFLGAIKDYEEDMQYDLDYR